MPKQPDRFSSLPLKAPASPTATLTQDDKFSSLPLLTPNIPKETVLPFPALNPTILNPMDDNHLLLSWDVRTTHSPANVTLFYDVYASPSPIFDTNAIKLNTLPIVLSMYEVTVPCHTIRGPIYYFVVSVGLNGNVVSPAIEASQYSFLEDNTTDDNMRYIIKEMLRRHRIMLARDAEDFIYYIKRVAGPRCTCYDPIRQASADSSCPDCFGTTFAGGYVAVRAPGRFTAATEIVARRQTGLEIGGTEPSGWNAIYPLVKSQDLIRRSSNIMYRVTTLTPQIHKGILTRQAWNQHELERGNIEYTLPVPPRT